MPAFAERHVENMKLYRCANGTGSESLLISI